MLSAVNSVKFASANNYKRTYTNTNQNINQNAVGYQQSFGARPARVLPLIGAALLAIIPHFATAAEKGAERAGKAATTVAKAAKKPSGPMKCKPDGFKHPENALERRLIPIPESLRIKLSEWGKAQEKKEFMGKWGILPVPAKALEEMVAAARRDGVVLEVESGYQRYYRCGEDDGVKYIREIDSGVDSGSAVTISDINEFRGNEESKWLLGYFEEDMPRHAERFGFEQTCGFDDGCAGKTFQYNPDRNLKSLIERHGKTAKISKTGGETAVTIPTKDGCTSTYYFGDRDNFATHVDEGHKWKHKCHTSKHN